MDINQMTISDKYYFFETFPVRKPNFHYVPYDESPFKINADYFFGDNVREECKRELFVSYFPMIPLLQKLVILEEADYILYMHFYARTNDMSDIVIQELHQIASRRKKGAQIIVVGKAANVKDILNKSKNIMTVNTIMEKPLY